MTGPYEVIAEGYSDFASAWLSDATTAAVSFAKKVDAGTVTADDLASATAQAVALCWAWRVGLMAEGLDSMAVLANPPGDAAGSFPVDLEPGLAPSGGTVALHAPLTNGFGFKIPMDQASVGPSPFPPGTDTFLVTLSADERPSGLYRSTLTVTQAPGAVAQAVPFAIQVP